MRSLDSLVKVVLVALVTVWTCSLAFGQDAAADEAKAQLKLGSTQFKDLDYKKAQETLLKVSRDKLPDADKSELDTLLANVKDCIKMQQAALDSLNQAEKAEAAGKSDQAIGLYEQVAKSQFLPDATRKDATAKANLLKTKAARPAYPAPENNTATKPAPAGTPDVKPAVAANSAEVKPAPAPAPAAKPADARAKADELIRAGNASLEAGKVDEAIVSFQQAVKVAPDYTKAQEELQSAQSVQAAGGAGSPLSRLAQMQQVRRQKAEAEIAQSVQTAKESLAKPTRTEDFARAREQLMQAQLVLNQNKSVYTDEEYRACKAQLDQMLAAVDSMQDQFNKSELRKQALEIEKAKALAEAEKNRRKQQTLAELRQSLVTLRDQGKYADAVDVAGRLKQLDPTDQWAVEQYATMSQFLLLMMDKRAHNDQLHEENRQLIDVRESGIPWYELLNYPRDWPEITLRRAGTGSGEAAESEANRATRRKMMQDLPKLEFNGITFNDVVQFLRDVSSTNIYVKWGALTAVGIDKNTPVNVKLQNVTFEKALKTILEDVGGVNPLGYIIDEGVIKISTRDDLAKETSTKVYDIRDLIVRRPNFTGPTIDLNSMNGGGNNNGGSCGPWGNSNNTSSGGTGGANNGGNNGEDNMPSRQELITNILELIRSTVDPTSWRENQGTIGSAREMGGMLVVTQTSENQRALQNLLNQLREAQALQINIEARFITVQSGFLNSIGLDLNLFLNIGSHTKNVFDPVTGAAAIDPLTGAKIINTAGGALLPQWNGEGNWCNRTTALPISLGSSAFAKPTGTSVPNSIGVAAAGVNALNVAGSFLDDIQVDFVLSATQANTNTRTLVAPRITIFDGQRAFVTVATQQAYVANIEPVVSENATAFRPQIATVATGSVLDVEGTVSADKRYVNMTLRPTISTINGFTEYQGAVDAQGNPVPGSGVLQLPNITIQQLACSVSVPDGGTLLLGGQKLSGEVEKEMGVPLISKIPILNRLTSNRSIVRDEQTLLIMVKPKIIIQKEYEEASFPP